MGVVMSTVVIEQAKIQLTVEQLIDAIRQLPPAEQELVRRAIDDTNWQDHFRSILDEIDRRVAATPISEDEIHREVEAARDDQYHQSNP